MFERKPFENLRFYRLSNVLLRQPVVSLYNKYMIFYPNQLCLDFSSIDKMYIYVEVDRYRRDPVSKLDRSIKRDDPFKAYTV